MPYPRLLFPTGLHRTAQKHILSSVEEQALVACDSELLHECATHQSGIELCACNVAAPSDNDASLGNTANLSRAFLHQEIFATSNALKSVLEL